MSGESLSADNFQWGVVSLDGTNTGLPPDTSINPSKARPPMVDGNSRVVTRAADAGGFLDGGFPINRQTQPTAAVDRFVQHIGAGQILSVYGFKDIAGSQFIQLYDSAILPTALPFASIPVFGGAGESFSYDVPWRFAFGFAFAISSTPLTYTAIAGSHLFAWAKFVTAT